MHRGGKLKLAAFFYDIVTLFKYLLEVAGGIRGRRDLDKRCHSDYLLSQTHISHLLGEEKYAYLFCCHGKKRT